ncbi:MAG TPA: class I SAM-dependent methyltransferase [Gemmatimonadaceae bacterium]|nr:class I SAM-dependent methyltransferase [Gemmatimonadaceae bacterium]
MSAPPSGVSRGLAVLPADFDAVADEAWARMHGVPGFLKESEARFLALAAAATPADGTILEIGSFKGKSTVGLATVARRYGLGPVVAVDPHTAPSVTDPDLGGQTTSFDDFVRALREFDVAEEVEVHRTFSGELAKSWSRPLRLLWIDGDHTYTGAKSDFDLYRPFLQEGAVVAFHDALNHYDGPLRVFVDDVLRSDAFGPAGFVGSIAWAQYRPRDGGSEHFRRARRRLARRAARLVPLFGRPRPLRWWDLQRVRLWRALLPHGTVEPRAWARQLAPGRG